MRSPHWRWRAAEFLLLEQFSNGVNTYTRGNGSGTSRKQTLWMKPVLGRTLSSALPERLEPAPKLPLSLTGTQPD